MTDFLINYGLFFLKLFSIVAAVLLSVAGIAAIVSQGKQKNQGKLAVKALNKKYQDYMETLLTDIKDEAALKALKKTRKKKSAADKKRLFVINFHGDIRASAVTSLREEISALLLIIKPERDEVLVKLESGGGMVNAYGLAASQLNRIKSANIKVTVAVDKVAASGGYMMACISDQIIAAPFAIIGSIGVIAQLPNFHHFLKDKHIDFEQISAGEYKRTLTLLGKNTDKGRQKMQSEVDETHALFKDHIRRHRPQIIIDEIATGEHWYATQAKNLNLVDELTTSDDFLLSKYNTHELFEIHYDLKKTLPQKLSSTATTLWHSLWCKPVKVKSG